MGHNHIVEPCRCGRYPQDIKDLVCIQEEYHRGRRWRGLLKPSKYSLVACLRPYCRGCYKTAAAFVERLPRALLQQWQRLKRLQENEDPGAQDLLRELTRQE